MTTFIHPSNHELVESGPVREVLRSKRGLSASLPEVLGAVGISILVLGLAGFGIGAGINFANDSGAKSQLESVASAQVLHQTKTGSFGGLDDLTSGDSPALTGAPEDLVVSVSDDGRDFCTAIESASMQHTRFVRGAQGDTLELKPQSTAVDEVLGCVVPGRSVTIEEHGEVPFATFPVPEGATQSCIFLKTKTGPGATRAYALTRELSASKGLVRQTSVSPAVPTGEACKTLQGATEFVQWKFYSDAGSPAFNTLGNTYSDIIVIFK